MGTKNLVDAKLNSIYKIGYKKTEMINVKGLIEMNRAEKNCKAKQIRVRSLCISPLLL